MLGFDDGSSNSSQESSPSKESNDTGSDFSTINQVEVKTMTRSLSCPLWLQEKAFEQGHVINLKISTQHTQN